MLIEFQAKCRQGSAELIICRKGSLITERLGTTDVNKGDYFRICKIHLRDERKMAVRHIRVFTQRVRFQFLISDRRWTVFESDDCSNPIAGLAGALRIETLTKPTSVKSRRSKPLCGPFKFKKTKTGRLGNFGTKTLRWSRLWQNPHLLNSNCYVSIAEVESWSMNWRNEMSYFEAIQRFELIFLYCVVITAWRNWASEGFDSESGTRLRLWVE